MQMQATKAWTKTGKVSQFGTLQDGIAHALELGRFSTRDNSHNEVLRKNKIFVLTYVDRNIE
jgi:hypothetical protein